jgi:aspartyl-tRNA(Asn)/glutamyl-tRNA(Gln) amidotransferase subunit B
LAEYFEQCVRLHPQPKTVSNWIMVELMRELKREEKEIEQCPIRPSQLAALLDLIREGVISGKLAKIVFEEMFQTGQDPGVIVEGKGMVQMTDPELILPVVDDVLKASPDQVAQYRAGKNKVFGYLVGEVMKRTRGQANPKLVNEMLKKKLEA